MLLAKGYAEYDQGARSVRTEVAHILPESFGAIEAGQSKEEFATSVWTLLEDFGYDVYDELKGNNIHRLENVMTLSADIHDNFDQMWLWLEAVPNEDDCYNVVLAPGFTHDMLLSPTIVKFVAHHSLPLPSPQYLAIHATCCRVASLSGAGRYLDTIIQEMEDMNVLAEDGSSAEMFTWALQGLRTVPSP